MVELLEKMYQKEDQVVKDMKKALKKCPKGSLEMQKSEKGNRWYWKCSDKDERRKYGKKKIVSSTKNSREKIRLKPEDHEIVVGIRNRFLCSRRLKAAEKNRKWIKLLLDHYEPSDEKTAINKLKEPYKSLVGFEAYVEEEHIPVQSENPYYKEHLIHKNSVGEYFRSKAEMQISELLLGHGILYRYEMKLEMVSGEIKYPDFTVKKSKSAEKKYIEYFGLIEKEEYASNMVEKIKWYLDRGFIPGKDVLFLYETTASGMDLTTILGQIYHFLEA